MTDSLGLRPDIVRLNGVTKHFRVRKEVVELQESLANYGYGITVSGTYDETTAMVVTAFQRHFRPAQLTGIADPSTRDTLARLIGG